jgi:hypothetical protein
MHKTNGGMSSYSTPLVKSPVGFFSKGDKVIGLDGLKLHSYTAFFVRYVDENTCIINWECDPKVEVSIQSSHLRSALSISGSRSSRSRATPTSDASIEYSVIKRRKLEFTNDDPQHDPQRVAKVFGDDGRLYFGSVMSYRYPYWMIAFDDGDRAEYNETQMFKIIDLYNRNKQQDVEGGGNHGPGQSPSYEQASTGNESSTEWEELVHHSPSDDDGAGPASSVHSTGKREPDRTRGADRAAADSPVSSVHGADCADGDSFVSPVHGADCSDGTPHSGADSPVSSVHGRARVSYSTTADSSPMDDSFVVESGIEQQSGESDTSTTMQDHSNDELQQLRERYIQSIKLFKSFSIEEFARNVQNDDTSVGIEVSPDADSFVFGTRCPEDFHCLNSTESFNFQRAVPNVRPFSVRPAIKKTKYFKPSYGNGKTPKMPSKLHKFPSFSAGSVKFKGAVTGYLSIHLLEKTKLGQACSIQVTNTWNVANNLALTHYGDSIVMEEPEWNEAMESYKKFDALQIYNFTGKGKNKEMTFPGIRGILHLRIVYDMLENIARDSHGQDSKGGDPGAARLLLTTSYILLQAPGFKKQWGMMQLALDPPIPEVVEVFKVENYEHDYAEWNQKLKAMTTDTHHRAEAFFINLPRLGDTNHDESAFYAIDIAFKIGCTDAKWDVLLSGEVAEETVLAATKLRRAELWEVDQESSEHDESPQEAESSVGDGTALLEWDPDEDDSATSWRPDHERADDNDPESQREDQVADDDDDPFSELADLMNRNAPHNNPNESSGQVLQAPEGHDMHTTELLESAAMLHSGGMNRIRYPTFGTTGIAFGNAQSKPGINLVPTCDNHGRVFLSLPEISHSKQRSVSLAQLYQPYQRFGMGVQTRVATRLEARKLPKMIADYASEFETLLVGDKNGKKVFALIDDIFTMITDYLAGLEVHPLHVRYELTFVTDMNDPLDILPPINDNTSPFKCVRLAKKADILDSMKKLIEMHRDVIDGFRRLETFPNLSTTMHPDQWTAIIASAEAVVNFIGMGGGAKGTILKKSLDLEPAFFFGHYWMAHPEFITLLPPRAESLEGSINQGGTDIIRFGVDSNLLAFATPQRAIEDEAPNITILRSLDYVDGTLSMYLIEGLPKLDEPAPYRKCMLLIYTALLAAGKEAGNSEEVVTIFDRIQWTGVGLQVASVNYVFTEIAAALVALYKVEWANRNTRSIELKLRKMNSDEGRQRAADFGKKREQFVLDLRDSHTKSELVTLILNCLDNVWPFDSLPFDSSDNNSSKMTQAGRAT